MAKAKKFDPAYYYDECAEIGLAPTLIVDAKGDTWISHPMPVGESRRVRTRYDKLSDYYCSFEREAAQAQLCDFLDSTGRDIC